jgi:hypothetical protein
MVTGGAIYIDEIPAAQILDAPVHGIPIGACSRIKPGRFLIVWRITGHNPRGSRLAANLLWVAGSQTRRPSQGRNPGCHALSLGEPVRGHCYDERSSDIAKPGPLGLPVTLEPSPIGTTHHGQPYQPGVRQGRP